MTSFFMIYKNTMITFLKDLLRDSIIMLMSLFVSIVGYLKLCIIRLFSWTVHNVKPTDYCCHVLILFHASQRGDVVHDAYSAPYIAHSY